jgi:rod shape-determining protein MreC
VKFVCVGFVILVLFLIEPKIFMNLYSKNRNLRWKNAVMTGAIVLLFTAGLFLFESPIKNIFFSMVSPLLQLSWKAGDSTSSLLSPVLALKNSTTDRNALQQQNESLLLQVASLQESLKAYQELTQAAQSTQGENFKLVATGAIGQDSSSDFILIDKGAHDGIAENMPVISADRVLYGKVSKVYQDFSQVMLVSHKSSVVDVRIESQAIAMPGDDLSSPPIFGAIKGNGSSSVYLDLVPLDAQINQGDAIITSGQEGVFPKNLLIGKLSVIHKNDTKPFQTADIQSFLDPKKMDNLFVITNYLRK